jgi:hypothetical protein
MARHTVGFLSRPIQLQGVARRRIASPGPAVGGSVAQMPGHVTDEIDLVIRVAGGGSVALEIKATAKSVT